MGTYWSSSIPTSSASGSAASRLSASGSPARCRVCVTLPILPGNAGHEGAPIEAPSNLEVRPPGGSGGADGIREGPQLRDRPRPGTGCAPRTAGGGTRHPPSCWLRSSAPRSRQPGLLADAGHALTDAAGLSLSLVAAVLSTRAGTDTRTWGFRRAEVLAAAAQAAVLLAVGRLHPRRGRAPARRPRRDRVHCDDRLRPRGTRRQHRLDRHPCRRPGRRHERARGLPRGGHRRARLGGCAHGRRRHRADRLDQGGRPRIAAHRRPDPAPDVAPVARVGRRAPGVHAAQVDPAAVRRHLLPVPPVHGVHNLHATMVATGLPVLTAHVVIDDDCFRDGHLVAKSTSCRPVLWSISMSSTRRSSSSGRCTPTTSTPPTRERDTAPGQAGSTPGSRAAPRRLARPVHRLRSSARWPAPGLVPTSSPARIR